MKDVFLFLIEQLNSAVFILLFILGVLFWLAIKFGSWIEKQSGHDKRIDKFESRLDILPALQERINIIYENFQKNPLVATHSPLDLTKEGQKLSEQLKIKEIFEKYKEILIKSFKKPDNFNAYDVQKQSFDLAINYLKTKLENEDEKILKNTAFERGILLDDILSIIGIHFRDFLLNKYNFKVSEIDSHDPTKK